MITKDKYINIALAINDQYIGQASALIISIHKNLKEGRFVRINILHSTVTEQHQDIIKNMVKDFNNISELNFIDMKQFTSNEILDKYLYPNYITSESFYRLFMPAIFPQYDKMLYLDSDTIVCKDLSQLYNNDIDNFYAGVIKEPISSLEYNTFFDNERITNKSYITKKLQINPKDYFNSGVLLLNLKKLRQDKIQEKFFEYLLNKSPFRYPDQDVLNIVLYKKVKFLDILYNLTSPEHNNENQKRAVIVHFTGEKKPWIFYKRKETFEQYWKYFKLTPFYKDKEKELYLSLTSGYLDKPFIKIREEKNHYKIKVFFFHFTINKKYVKFFRKNESN